MQNINLDSKFKQFEIKFQLMTEKDLLLFIISIISVVMENLFIFVTFDLSLGPSVLCRHDHLFL